MEIRIDIAPLASKEDKLQDIADYLEQLKDALAEVVEEYEGDDADEGKMDTLTEALEALPAPFDKEDLAQEICDYYRGGPGKV